MNPQFYDRWTLVIDNGWREVFKAQNLWDGLKDELEKFICQLSVTDDHCEITGEEENIAEVRLLVTKKREGVLRKAMTKVAPNKSVICTSASAECDPSKLKSLFKKLDRKAVRILSITGSHGRLHVVEFESQKDMEFILSHLSPLKEMDCKVVGQDTPVFSEVRAKVNSAFASQVKSGKKVLRKNFKITVKDDEVIGTEEELDAVRLHFVKETKNKKENPASCATKPATEKSEISKGEESLGDTELTACRPPAQDKTTSNQDNIDQLEDPGSKPMGSTTDHCFVRRLTYDNRDPVADPGSKPMGSTTDHCSPIDEKPLGSFEMVNMEDVADAAVAAAAVAASATAASAAATAAADAADAAVRDDDDDDDDDECTHDEEAKHMAIWKLVKNHRQLTEICRIHNVEIQETRCGEENVHVTLKAASDDLRLTALRQIDELYERVATNVSMQSFPKRPDIDSVLMEMAVAEIQSMYIGSMAIMEITKEVLFVGPQNMASSALHEFEQLMPQKKKPRPKEPPISQPGHAERIAGSNAAHIRRNDTPDTESVGGDQASANTERSNVEAEIQQQRVVYTKEMRSGPSGMDQTRENPQGMSQACDETGGTSRSALLDKEGAGHKIRDQTKSNRNKPKTVRRI